jgi:hypothetical protein
MLDYSGVVHSRELAALKPGDALTAASPRREMGSPARENINHPQWD